MEKHPKGRDRRARGDGRKPVAKDSVRVPPLCLFAGMRNQGESKVDRRASIERTAVSHQERSRPRKLIILVAFVLIAVPCVLVVVGAELVARSMEFKTEGFQNDNLA